MKRHYNRLTRLCPSSAFVTAHCRIFVLILAMLVSTIPAYSQVLYPHVETPIDAPDPDMVLDTLFNDSLSVFASTQPQFVSDPNTAIKKKFFPDNMQSMDGHIWGPWQYRGHTFDLTFQAYDPLYFQQFPAGQTLLKQTYTLTMYAPGDMQMQNPIYQGDVYVEMTTETPSVKVSLDLGQALQPYIPKNAFMAQDAGMGNVSSYISDIYDSLVVGGPDSVTVGQMRVPVDDAFALIDVADMTNRGINPNASLRNNLPIVYTLQLNQQQQNFVLQGFNLGSVGVNVNTRHIGVLSGGWVSSSSGGPLPVGPFGGGGVPIGGGPVVVPGGGVLPHSYGGPVIVIPWPWWWWSPCGPLNTTGAITSNPVTYRWTDCPFYNYQIQILRLHNIDPTLITDPHNIVAKVDWTQALDLETNNGDQSIRLTTTEGTGYYAYRVRRVYDTWPNTIGDDRNYGPWTGTGTLVNGATVTLSSGSVNNYLFYYDVFNDSLNYIFHRQFVEGEINHGSQLRVGETTTFANYLLMPVQEQARVQAVDNVIASQTIPDKSGRPMMQTLPAPLNRSGFSYEYDYIKNKAGNLYTANDYDLQANHVAPSIVNAASKVVKYYSNLNGDVQIPTCDSLPYARTLNYNDGLNRPREIASPGAYHNFGSTHTVKKYYCSPSSAELIRVFGDEAPRSESVLKTYTLDPNEVLSVTYTDEITGKVLATCLSAPQPERLLMLPDNPFTVRDTVTVKTPYTVPSRLIETKTYTFAIPTKLDFLYSIIPNIYGDTCLGLCSTCDYFIDITASNIDDTEVAHQYHTRITVTPSWDSTGAPCPSVAITNSGSYSIAALGSPPGAAHSTTLDPGTYVVTAAILLGNTNPSTGIPYVVEMDSILMFKYRNQVWNTPGTVLGGSPPGPVTLGAMQAFLAAKDMDGLLAYAGADTSQPYFTFVVGCDSFLLPTQHCKKHSCAVIDFAEYMVDQLLKYDTVHGVTTFSTVTDISQTTDAANLFLVNSNADFNAIIGRMIADGYDCDSLWNAWVQTVGWYAASQAALTTGVMTPGTTKSDWWQHYMDMVGYKFPFTDRPVSELGSPSTPLYDQPYKYFPYNWGSAPGMEDLFCYQYETGVLGSSWGGGCSTGSGSGAGWVTAVLNFPGSLPSNAFHMFNFYLAIKPSSPTYTSGMGSATGFTGGSTPAAYATMQNICYNLCDSRYQSIADEIANQYMTHGVYVPGYAYLSWHPTPRIDTIELPKVYCMASAVVSDCKAGCKLTPNPSTGIVPPAQILAFQKSMSYAVKLRVPIPDSAGCAADTICVRDTTVHFKRDSLTCSLHGGIPQCDTVWYGVDSTYCVAYVIDTNFVQVYNTDTMYSMNDAFLTFLNKRYKFLYDSLVQIGYPSNYNWAYMSDPGMRTFGSVGSLCTSAIPIMPGSPRGFFSYDTLHTKTDPCPANNMTTYRTAKRNALLNSTQEMVVNIVIGPGGAVAAGDSIWITENLPAGTTLISTNGIDLGSGVIRYTGIGPMAVGDTVKMRYKLRMPPIPANLFYSGGMDRFYSGTPVPCTVPPDTMHVDSCVLLHYVVAGGAQHFPITPCRVCYEDMGCRAHICMYYTRPDVTSYDSTHVITCAEFVCSAFNSSLVTQVQNYADMRSTKLMHAYEVMCNDPAKIRDVYENSYELNQYQYTLYYYDRAGNLIRSVSPEGVRDTATGRFMPPDHDFVSKYEYNTLGQMTRQETPDGGVTKFWYDKRGKARLSQNDKQKVTNSYSYNKYDPLGRLIEAGEVASYPGTGAYPFVDTNDLYNPNWPPLGVAATPITFLTQTVYSSPCPFLIPGYGAFTGANLQNKVSYVMTDRDGKLATTNDQVHSIYSYDLHGNVAALVQHIGTAPNGVIIDYQYDLVSKKVVKTGQRKLGSPIAEDYLAHWYSYDGDKRLTNVQSSHASGPLAPWTPEAKYSYYLHGPLRRHLVGNNLQGLDYTYTLQGWLKGINHSKLRRSYDPGNDSVTTPKDVWGMVLGYHEGDFMRTGSSLYSQNWATTLHGVSLYDGTITSWQQNMKSAPGISYPYAQENGSQFRYDQLNRLGNSDFYIYDNTSGWMRPPVSPYPYNEYFSYDRNGNIKTLYRSAHDGFNGILADNLTYNYAATTAGRPLNRLSSVSDAVAPIASLNDVENSSFVYNANGQLEKETTPTYGLDITWTPNGKVDVIRRTWSGIPGWVEWRYLYDGMGNQVQEEVVNYLGVTSQQNYHIFDANHQKVAMYSIQPPSFGVNTMAVIQRYLYGRDRLGIIEGPNVVGPFIWGIPWVWGPSHFKFYEFLDHLGNVKARIPGWAPPVTGVDVVNSYNYYAFGSFHDKRTVQSLGWSSFGFNGQEKRDEITQIPGGHTHALYWEYDTRLGRRWNLDPVDQMNMSNYAVMGDCPTVLNDPLGNDPNARARAFAQSLGLKNFNIGRDKHGGAVLGWGKAESDGSFTVFTKLFKATFFEKIGARVASIAEKAGDMVRNAHFTIEGAVKIDGGISFKEDVKSWGTIEVALVKFELFSAKLNNADPANPFSYDYIGRDGVKVTQKIEVTAGKKIGDGGKALIGFNLEHKFTGHQGYAEDDEWNVDGFFGVEKKTKPAKEIPRELEQASAIKPAKFEARSGVGNKQLNFIDVSGSGAYILGIKFNLKVGLKW